MLVERMTLRQPWEEGQIKPRPRPPQSSCNTEILLLLARVGQALPHIVSTHCASYASSQKLR